MSCTTRNRKLAVASAISIIGMGGMLLACNESVRLVPEEQLFSRLAIQDTSITLMEPPNFVLQDPLCLATSPSGKHLAITDRATGMLMVYEVKTGKLVTTYRAGIDLMDSVVDATSAWPFKNVIDSNGASLLRFSEVLDGEGNPTDPEKLSREIPNRIRSCAFIDDSTVIMSAELNGVVRHPDHGKMIQGSYAVTGLIEYDIKNKHVRAHPFDGSTVDARRPYVPQPDVLVRRESSGTLLISCLYLPDINYSLVRPVMEVDENWHEIRRLGELPPILLKKSFRDFHSEFMIADISGGDRVLVAFRVLPYVFDYLKGTSFRLHTSSDNQEYLNRVDRWVKDTSSMPADSVLATLNCAVQSVEPMGGDSLLVVLWDRGQGGSKLTLLGQEYRITGEFLRSYKIAEAEDEGFFPKVAYSMPLKRIVVVQSNDSTWQLRLMRSPQ